MTDGNNGGRRGLLTVNRRRPKPGVPREMQIEVILISSLRPYERNARLHSPKQIREIADSMTKYGVTKPILVDGNGVVVAGHASLEALRLLGRTRVHVIRLEHLTEAQLRAYRLADNKLAENSSWDVEIPGIDETASPVTHDGDLWILGRHRLYCGDARKALSFERLMGKDKAQMVFTDPPYNVVINGNVSGLGRTRHREFAMGSGEMSVAQFSAFLTTVFRLLADHSVDGSIHEIFMDWRHLHEIVAAGQRAYSELKNLVVWVKDNGGMGSLFRSRHELVFVFKHGGAPHVNNVELGKHGRNRDNVWCYPGVNTMRAGRLEELAMHPTPKPVALVADAIMDCSRRGDIVLDCFGGSGTTLIAAEKTGRRAYLIEIDAAYVDATISRYQKLTGKSVFHEDSGLTFDQMKAERAAGGLQ